MIYEEESRPDPDQLLRQIKKDERSQGRLKIFLGMVAGVGKTYGMLKSAKSLQDKGIDIVIGYVETHGRKETQALLAGFESIPRKTLIYKDTPLTEFDVEAVLKRNPQIAVVDELPHTNAPGSRNNKRYLDILELIHAGIDVFTTVNVQHFESRVHIVKEITGITISETVPDSFLDLADEIVVIDLPPEELVKRLQEGLIYPLEQAEIAEKNFFQIGNLTALRELALRSAAERVDKDLREYRQAHNIQEVWKSSHRLLVAVFASPYAENLIRATRNLADTLDASWLGVYVDHGHELSIEERNLLAKNIALVQELGGEFIASKDEDPARGLLRVARQQNVSQIIVGRSARSWWHNALAGGSFGNRLMKLAGDIDIYSVANVEKYGQTSQKARLYRALETGKTASEMGLLFTIACASWLLASALSQYLGYLAIGFIFLLVVSISGLYLAHGSVVILAAAFALIHNFFFIPPLYTLQIEHLEDLLMLCMFFISASVTGHLTSRLRAREKTLVLREESTLAFYHLAKELLSAKGVDDLLKAGASYLEKTFPCDTLVLCTHAGTKKYAGSWSYALLGEKEKAVIDWVITNGKHAGRFTQTLAASQGYYTPLLGKTKGYGVIGMNAAGIRNLEAHQIAALENFANQIASALEKELLQEQAKKFDVIEKSHKLYKTILDSVSHELKTPLSAITGCASALLDPVINKNPQATLELAQEILIGSLRLTRIVENLLDMSRIDSGFIQPKIAAYSINEIVQAAIRKFHAETPSRRIQYKEEILESGALCDPTLSEQAIFNILHNAHMYSAENKPIDINIYADEDRVKITIRDYGSGIKTNEENLIFEKFYRASPHLTGGIGLGLSIVKNFIELQNGKVTAGQAPEGGAVFTILLPTAKKQ